MRFYKHIDEKGQIDSYSFNDWSDSTYEYYCNEVKRKTGYDTIEISKEEYSEFIDKKTTREWLESMYFHATLRYGNTKFLKKEMWRELLGKYYIYI